MHTQRMVLLSAFGWMLGTFAVSVNAAGLDDSLFRLRDGRPMRASSSDPNWQTGNEDYRPIAPGETLVVADLEGPGVIRHIWFTINAKDPRYGRSLVLRMYWDNQEQPAVESPLGDFFAVGHGTRRLVDSAPVAVTSEGRAYNCYWPMPFGKRARITLTNDSPQHKVGNAYFYVDYEKVAQLPPDTANFHAQYRQEFPTQMGRNYLILDAEGSGQYVGTVLSAYCRTSGWFGEGDDFFYIDGESELSLRGTGTEDYFCDAWGFREFHRPYYGVVQYDGASVGNRLSAYRWHIPDPVSFKKSLRVEIEHQGVTRDEQDKRVSGAGERADLFSSVAFWYQTGKAKRFAELPPVAQRVVPQTLIELEDQAQGVKTTPANVATESSRGCLDLKCTDPQTTITIPFELSAAKRGVGRVQLGAGPEGGVWRVALDGTPSEGAHVIDTYSATPSSRDISLNLVNLAAGSHTLTFACSGRHPASHGYWLSVDAFMVDEVTVYAVPVK